VGVEKAMHSSLRVFMLLQRSNFSHQLISASLTFLKEVNIDLVKQQENKERFCFSRAVGTCKVFTESNLINISQRPESNNTIFGQVMLYSM